MRPVARVVVCAAAVVVVAAVAGCGDDGGSAAEPGEGTTVSTSDGATEAPPAEGVELTADVRLDGSRVVFDYTLANTGDEPAAIVDPERVTDTLEEAGEGGYRAAFLRTEGDAAGGAAGGGAGGSPLPMLDGLVVAEGAEVSGTAGITGGFETLPATVELCVEVVPQPWNDAGGGVAQFPYRAVGTPPTLACTGPLPVPGTG